MHLPIPWHACKLVMLSAGTSNGLQQILHDLFGRCLNVPQVVNDLFQVLVHLQAQKRGPGNDGLHDAAVLQGRGGAMHWPRWVPGREEAQGESSRGNHESLAERKRWVGIIMRALQRGSTGWASPWLWSLTSASTQRHGPTRACPLRHPSPDCAEDTLCMLIGTCMHIARTTGRPSGCTP